MVKGGEQDSTRVNVFRTILPLLPLFPSQMWVFFLKPFMASDEAIASWSYYLPVSLFKTTTLSVSL